MIFVVEMPRGAEAQAWFAYDLDDLLRKIEARDPTLLAAIDRDDSPPAGLAADGPRCRIYWTEAEATAAFERAGDVAWQGEGWRARWALRDQLVALEVLADDL